MQALETGKAGQKTTSLQKCVWATTEIFSTEAAAWRRVGVRAGGPGPTNIWHNMALFTKKKTQYYPRGAEPCVLIPTTANRNAYSHRLSELPFIQPLVIKPVS
jgi:hypothetical protein